MEDIELKELFKAYNPELPSDSLFMAQLERRLDSVEIVREHTRKMKRYNFIAIVVALAVGIVSGFLFSLFLPAIGEAVEGMAMLPTDAGVLRFFAEHYFSIVLTLIALASAFLSLNTFELAMAVLRKREG